MQHLPRLTLWMYRRAACTTYPQSQWVVEVLEGFSTLGTTLSLHGAFHGIWNNHWSMSFLYTNNLFVIAKCTYATPDSVQPDHQYLRVHCVYPLCLVSHVPSLQPTYLFQHFAKFLSLFFPVKSSPLLCHLLRPSHSWAKPNVYILAIIIRISDEYI